jgi:hypothetical protein
MRRHFLSVALFILAIAPPVAAERTHHGSDCVAALGSQQQYVGYNSYGVYNDSTQNGISLICPTDPFYHAYQTEGVLYLYDRDSTDSVTVSYCDVDSGGTISVCGSASTGVSFVGADYPLVPDVLSGLPAYGHTRYLNVYLPKKTANGTSHFTTFTMY